MFAGAPPILWIPLESLHHFLSRFWGHRGKGPQTLDQLLREESIADVCTELRYPDNCADDRDMLARAALEQNVNAQLSVLLDEGSRSVGGEDRDDFRSRPSFSVMVPRLVRCHVQRTQWWLQVHCCLDRSASRTGGAG